MYKIVFICGTSQPYRPEQEGFRRFHGTTTALLRHVQSIVGGFNDGKSTVAVYIDMEKAHASIWRNGLLSKMNNLGIKGKIRDGFRFFAITSCVLLPKRVRKYTVPYRYGVATGLSAFSASIQYIH